VTKSVVQWESEAESKKPKQELNGIHLTQCIVQFQFYFNNESISVRVWLPCLTHCFKCNSWYTYLQMYRLI